MFADTEFLCDVIFVTSFVTDRITKIVTKFWIHIKRTDRPHGCHSHANY